MNKVNLLKERSACGYVAYLVGWSQAVSKLWFHKGYLSVCRLSE